MKNGNRLSEIELKHRTIERIIGKYQGVEQGPLLICIGAMHGNEPSGVEAIQTMISNLKLEPISNPDFVYKGTFVGLIGNIGAFKENKRFITRDMNRMFIPELIESIKTKDHLEAEERELMDLLDVIHAEIESSNAEKIILLDLHTTSSSGGIFSISTEDPESIRMSIELHAPVITGLLKGLKGTTLHYFNSKNFKTDITALTFESGQHNDPLSVNRAIAAITNCMRSIGSVNAEHVENRHDQLLVEYSKNLPKVVHLVERYDIESEDQFRMQPNYKNFQEIEKGEILAKDKSGVIRASKKGRILMPLYQEQGEEGFFIVEDQDAY